MEVDEINAWQLNKSELDHIPVRISLHQMCLFPPMHSVDVIPSDYLLFLVFLIFIAIIEQVVPFFTYAFGISYVTKSVSKKKMGREIKKDIQLLLDEGFLTQIYCISCVCDCRYLLHGDMLIRELMDFIREHIEVKERRLWKKASFSCFCFNKFFLGRNRHNDIPPSCAQIVLITLILPILLHSRTLMPIIDKENPDDDGFLNTTYRQWTRERRLDKLRARSQ